MHFVRRCRLNERSVLWWWGCCGRAAPGYDEGLSLFQVDGLPDCGAYAERCDTIVIGCDAAGAATANVLISTDGGNTWAATAADPFATDENITSIRMFQVDATTVRILAARDTDAANPMELAYSDDSGANWTLVVLGATNGEFAERDQAIMVIDESNIWVCTDQGNVYFSSDGGATFTVQSSALTASGGNDLNACHFATNLVGISVGDSDTIIYTDFGITKEMRESIAAADGLGRTVEYRKLQPEETLPH